MHKSFWFAIVPLWLFAGLAAPVDAQDSGVPIDLNSSPADPVSTIHHGMAEFLEDGIFHPPAYLPRPFTRVGDDYFFSGTTGLLGEAAYKTNGQPGGTALLLDAYPGAFSSFGLSGEDVAHFTPFNGGVAFITSQGSERRLFFYDPASQQVQKVADIGGDPQEFEDGTLIVLNGKLVFPVNDGIFSELWSSDGTAAGTGPFLDQLGLSSGHGVVRHLTAAPNGQVAFMFLNGSGQPRGVYRTDGTASGTQLLVEGFPDFLGKERGEDLIAFLGDQAIISMVVNNKGCVLYGSDGTPAGTRLLKDFTPQTGLPADLEGALEWDGKLYFNGAVTNKVRKLYETNGRPNGTFPVGKGIRVPSEPWDMQMYAGRLHFTALTPNGQRELYKYDGRRYEQLTGTALGDYFGAGRELTQAGGVLFYVDEDATSSRLVASLGTGDKTHAVAGVPVGTTDQPVRCLTPTPGGQLLLSAPSRLGRAGLWSVDPQTLFATMVFELDGAGATESSNPQSPARVGGDVYVSAGADGERGVWRIDDQLVPTEVVKGARLNVTQGPEFFELADQAVLFFTAEAAGFGGEPYVWNAAARETVQLGDLSPGVASTKVLASCAFAGALYFIAETEQGAGGLQTWLYRSDGSAAGTVALHTAADSVLQAFGDRLLFMHAEDASGVEPWLTDGTSAGAALLADLTPGNGSTQLLEPQVIGNRLLFLVTSSPYRGTLYVSDGTAAGTTSLGTQGGVFLSLEPGDHSLRTAVWNEELYLTIDDGFHGRELWKSGGTPESTQLVVDLTPGSSGSKLTYLTAGEGGVYFANGVGILLSDLYRTDGTATGTHQLTLPAITGTLGFIYALHSTADGLYVRITEMSSSEPIFLVQGDQVTTVCSGLQVPFGSTAPWLETLAGGVLTTGSSILPEGTEPTFIALGLARTQAHGHESSSGSLSANAPQLGQVVTVQSTGAPGVSMAALVSAPPAPWPIQVPALAEQLVWLDPSHMQLAAVQAGANWSVSMAVPSNPALVGKAVMVQALYLEALGLPGELSNALTLTVGF